jgi:hypothetical protein
MITIEKVVNYNIVDLFKIYNLICYKVGLHLTLFEKNECYCAALIFLDDSKAKCLYKRISRATSKYRFVKTVVYKAALKSGAFVEGTENICCPYKYRLTFQHYFNGTFQRRNNIFIS